MVNAQKCKSFATKEKSVGHNMMTERIKFVSKLLGLFAATFLFMTGNAMAYEEPSYELIKATDVYEIRQYEVTCTL